MKQAGMEWIDRLKFRAAAWLVAILLAAVATITFAGLPALPIVGFAVAAAAVSVAKLTQRLARPTCLSCGHDLSSEPIGVHGIACPECGGVQAPSLADLARLDREDADSRA